MGYDHHGSGLGDLHQSSLLFSNEWRHLFLDNHQGVEVCLAPGLAQGWRVIGVLLDVCLACGLDGEDEEEEDFFFMSVLLRERETEFFLLLVLL